MKYDMVYPIIDEKREKQIPICTERLLYAGEKEGYDEYFFSPHFKCSDEIINEILKKYTFRPMIFNLMKPDIIVRQDFNKSINSEIEEVLKDSEMGDDERVSREEILVYYKNNDDKILLTRNRFLSDFERPDNGRRLNYLINDIKIEKNQVFTRSNKFTFEKKFSDNFMKIFSELKELNKQIEITSGRPLLNNEVRETRKNYLEILVDTVILGGGLSSSQVARIEVLARQLGIDSVTVLNMLSNGFNEYSSCGESEYAQRSEEKVHHNIAKKYQYMLYHDVIMLERLSQGTFHKRLADRLCIDDELAQNYSDSIQKFIEASDSLRQILDEKKVNVGNQKDDYERYENLYNSVECEFDLQKQLLR